MYTRFLGSGYYHFDENLISLSDGKYESFVLMRRADRTVDRLFCNLAGGLYWKELKLFQFLDLGRT